MVGILVPLALIQVCGKPNKLQNSVPNEYIVKHTTAVCMKGKICLRVHFHVIEFSVRYNGHLLCTKLSVQVEWSELSFSVLISILVVR